jgi:hypothetical protein
MHKSPISPAIVANIFRTLRGRFGSPFVERYRSGDVVPEGRPNAGKDTGLLEAMEVWAHELRDLTPADIEHGLKCKFKYPPSADEFVQACCTREFTPPPPVSDRAALPAPKMTREEAQVRIAEVGGAVKRFPTDNSVKLDWAYKIADEAARGVYCGGVHGKRMAADAIQTARKPVPESLQPFLTKTNPMEDAA